MNVKEINPLIKKTNTISQKKISYKYSNIIENDEKNINYIKRNIYDKINFELEIFLKVFLFESSSNDNLINKFSFNSPKLKEVFEKSIDNQNFENFNSNFKKENVK